MASHLHHHLGHLVALQTVPIHRVAHVSQAAPIQAPKSSGEMATAATAPAAATAVPAIQWARAKPATVEQPPRI